MKIRLNKVAKLGLVALVIATLGANFAFAGGSSYSFNFEGKTSFAAPGTTVYDVQKIAINTYFRSAPNSKIDARLMQLRITSLNISCYGDNAIKTANLRIGSHIYGTADFVKNPRVANLFEAVIRPSEMILENNSYYLSSVDFVTNSVGIATRIAACDITEIGHMVGSPGAEFTDRSKNIIMKYYNSPSVIIVGNLGRYDANRIGNNFDLKRPATGFMVGSIKSISGSLQLKIGSNNWKRNGFSTIMAPYTNETFVSFDILQPELLKKYDLNHTTGYNVQELHVYKKLGANGAVGSIVLTDY